MALFKIERTSSPTPAEARRRLLGLPGFGQVFTDHMALISYSDDQGWHDAKITARRPFQVDPASPVFHYGQEIFEGLKAYHHAPREGEKGVALFRPDANARRFKASARRLAMPELPEELFLQALEELLKVEKDWIPEGEGHSLYLRPFMISDGAFLGVKPANNYVFCVLASPAGSYFSKGAVSVWVSENYTRAAPGGTGEAKCGGNYAGSLVAQQEAKRQGCDQVLFLDSANRRYVEEMGGMNVMFVHRDGHVSTPPLNGTILRGITRDSLLRLGREMGIEMREEPVDIEEVFKGARSGEIVEAFACGTAAALSPIGSFRRPGGEVKFGDGNTPGPVTLKLREKLTGLQRGRYPDPFGWVQPVALD
ncbi:branched-chain amino acid aminotransferase [Oecophyllibacter saccharovorans]|uniref:branched-chain amino acid aminotransferase n=1 Tax=Oecophyllibacter saccharovorans TaxID=2558360 RepID=UPI001143CF60|nr:branched-chain amino acid aminotransferase [Oecophyllibacter saccharovorans]QDH15377.1 branched-chain amino acid aminotransferase [Oecophyllibacter saccharovorans]